jgi:tryptophan halogenase
MSEQINKIVIVGGGTAGWMTALLVNHFHKDYEITLIESEEIGILGAGEGTTPHFIDFLDLVNISASEIIENCKGTVKLGINFVNWNGDNKSYYHSFTPTNGLSEFSNDICSLNVIQNNHLDELSLVSKLCKNNKVPFSFNNSINAYSENPIKAFTQHNRWAMHFDARLLAKYFRKVAEQRGVIRVEGKLSEIKSNENHEIDSVVVNNTIYNCDFIFDCTGFARLIIGKFYQTEWKSYADHLPMKKALPFFIENNGDFAPQTDSIAMKYGWIWKIPVADRYGCGYVFDSSFISDEEALKEAEEYFNLKLESPKTFNFEAGVFKNVLVKNCMAVGISQGFVEPLEASSIYNSYRNLYDFLSSDGINVKSEVFKNRFNDRCYKTAVDILEFIQLHYLTKRNDSKFWVEFRNNNTIISNVNDILELLQENLNTDIETISFTNHSWIQVACGLELIDPLKLKEKFNEKELQYLSYFKNALLSNQQNVLTTCISNKDFLTKLKLNFPI